jgi:KDO2-lipid IV(A) lauroyltransferase
MAKATRARGQEWLWRLEAAAFDGFAWLMRRLPVDTASDLGAAVVGALGPFTAANRTVRKNMSIAFPEASKAELRRLERAQWREAGRLIAEFPIVDRIVSDPTRVEVVHRERLTALAENRTAAVLLSGHFSNFEIMAAAIVQAGVRCQLNYRATNNPHIDARIRESRARYGVTLFAPKGAEGAREMIRAFGRGESVALLSDQRFNGGVAAPFFGVTAYTAPGAPNFALKFRAPIVPMSVQRVDKARFRVIVHEPYLLERTGDRTADIEAGVRRINAFMEARIRERPAEWFWVNKRWPKETYRS